MKHVDSNVRERALRLNFETAVFQRFALMPTTPVCSSPRCCLGRDADGASRVWLVGEFDLAAAPEVDAALWQAKAKSDRVVVDLRRLVFQDRTCLQTLLVADAFARRAGAVIHKVLIGPADADAP